MSAITPPPPVRVKSPAANDANASPAAEALPPVRVLLAALLWLCTRQHGQPTPETTRAIALQLQRLAIHPEASIEDKRSGLRLAAEVYHDALLWLAVCDDADKTAH